MNPSASPSPINNPTTALPPMLEEIGKQKHRQPGETHEEAAHRVAVALSDDPAHRRRLEDVLVERRFLPGGRIQVGAGSQKDVSLFNCFVGQTIPDSLDGIMETATECARTMKAGGGVGHDFSTLRPAGMPIRSLGSSSRGPIPFMGVFSAIGHSVSSLGNRQGAQMGMLRIDHPDIEAFIASKHDRTSLTGMNISVAVTDEFMRALENDLPFDLQWGGEVQKTVMARDLWQDIMDSTWDWAEPGVFFVDTVNDANNLHYCETIATSNPCAELPLPPHGACLLGSFNLTRYVVGDDFDWTLFHDDVICAYRALDNVVEASFYPLKEQQDESYSKRRMGVGITGLANALEKRGYPYGSDGFRTEAASIMRNLRDLLYEASIERADTHGSFPLLEADEFLESGFAVTLPAYIRQGIRKRGIRNSHLLAIAPTGSISLSAGNVSSGIEPVFAHTVNRTVRQEDGTLSGEMELSDYAYREWGVKGKTADECSVEDHLSVMEAVVPFVDQAISKTINVGPNVSREEFEGVYLRAYKMGAKGCTTFRNSGKREGILASSESEAACSFDPSTGQRTCDQ